MSIPHFASEAADGGSGARQPPSAARPRPARSATLRRAAASSPRETADSGPDPVCLGGDGEEPEADRPDEQAPVGPVDDVDGDLRAGRDECVAQLRDRPPEERRRAAPASGADDSAARRAASGRFWTLNSNRASSAFGTNDGSAAVSPS